MLFSRLSRADIGNSQGLISCQNMESCSPRLCIDLNISKYKWLVFGCPAVIYDIQGRQQTQPPLSMRRHIPFPMISFCGLRYCTRSTSQPDDSFFQLAPNSQLQPLSVNAARELVLTELIRFCIGLHQPSSYRVNSSMESVWTMLFCSPGYILLQ